MLHSTTYYERRIKPNALGTVQVHVHVPGQRFVLTSLMSYPDLTDAIDFVQLVSKVTKGKVDVYHEKELLRRYVKGCRKRKF